MATSGSDSHLPTVSRRSVRWVAAVLIVGLVAVVALVGARLHARLEPVDASPVSPLAVQTRVLQPQTFVHSIHVSGSVEAERRVALSAQLAATVTEVPLREGAQVAEGAVLVRLDDAEQREEVARLAAAADRVEADLTFWQEQLATDRRLLESKTISRRAFDETRRQVASLEAAQHEARQALQSARIRLQYAVVCAPFDGFVQRVHVLPGELVQPGTPMLEVLAAEPLKVVVPVAESDLNQLQPDQTAQVQIPAVDGAWAAKVDRIYPGLEAGTRSATLELFLPRGLGAVRPGMAADVDLVLTREENALVVPRQAVRERQGKTGAYVLHEGEAQWRAVQTGAAQDGRVQILAGLQGGDEVIVTPHPQLADARPVVARNDWRGASP